MSATPARGDDTAPAEPRPAASLPRRWALLAFALLPLAACGRRGRPEPPDTADPAFPRTYPTR